MFLKNSRYFGLETIETRDHHGRPVRAVKSRGLPITPGRPYSVLGHDQLDVMSEQRYQDATRYWHIADANSDLEANELARGTGRVIQVPEK